MSSSRLIIGVVLPAILVVGLTACAPSRQERLESRWEEFVTMLPASAAGALEDGEYARAADRVDSALRADTAFARQWSELKKAEAIELFGTGDVIDYFVTYFGTD